MSEMSGVENVNHDHKVITIQVIEWGVCIYEYNEKWKSRNVVEITSVEKVLMLNLSLGIKW